MGDVGGVGLEPEVEGLRAEDRLGQDRRLGVGPARVARDEEARRLLEGGEPVGQLEAGGVEDERPLAEGVPVLAVRVDEDDVGLRVLGQDRPQDHHDGAGLARAGAAQDGEVLAQERVGQDEGGDLRVAPQAADADAGHRGLGVDDRRLARRRAGDRGVEGGVGGQAAAEHRGTVGRHDLTQEVEFGDRDVVDPPALAHAVDDADRPAVAGRHAHELADRDRPRSGEGALAQARGHHGAGDGEDVADRRPE